MKKKIIGAALFIAIAVAAGWNFTQSESTDNISILAFENIEALASSENSGYCTDGCKDIGWGTSQILKCDCSYTGIFSCCNTWGCIKSE